MSVKGVSLSTKQVKAIRALLECSTVADAAEKVGVNERTVYRWMKEPGFIAALREAETGAISDAVRSLIVDMKDVHRTMKEIKDNDEFSPAVRLRAAQVLDSSSLKWRVLSNQEGRLSELEEKYIELLERAESYERSRKKR